MRTHITNADVRSAARAIQGVVPIRVENEEPCFCGNHFDNIERWPPVAVAGAFRGGGPDAPLILVYFSQNAPVPPEHVFWTLLHEFGHYMQWATQFPPYVLVYTERNALGLEAPSSAVAAARLVCEMDAWRLAKGVAAQVGVRMSREARRYSEWCLSTYMPRGPQGRD